LRILILILVSTTSVWAAQSFQLTLEKLSTIIEAPSRTEWGKTSKLAGSEMATISVTFINKTPTNYHSLIKTQNGVLKRFVVKSNAQKTFEIEYSDNFNYFYVPMSPPGQTIELTFSGNTYEIPAKK
jgi:hypothetical protein